MANKTVPMFRPGQDFTGYCVEDVTAERLAYFAPPVEGTDHQLYVTNARAEAGDVPAGVVGFAQNQGGTTHVSASGILPIQSSTDAVPGNKAYDAGDGTVTTAAEGNEPVGAYATAAQAGQPAYVKLHLS